VTFKVDAFPKDTFHGMVAQVRMNATMVQSVVTYDTIIEFANPELKLFPGMTAYVTIPVATVKSALKVPNTALRYKPPMPSEEIQAIYQRYGIDGSGQRLTSADSAAAAVPPQPSAGAQASAGAQSPSRAPKSDTAVVWKFHADGTMEPVKVTIGITDHAFTEVLGVLKGELKEGDAVVIRSVVAKNQAPGKLPR
jgi:HlyD family secretion protein